mgnify:CR=1 FL=1
MPANLIDICGVVAPVLKPNDHILFVDIVLSLIDIMVGVVPVEVMFAHEQTLSAEYDSDGFVVVPAVLPEDVAIPPSIFPLFHVGVPLNGMSAFVLVAS